MRCRLFSSFYLSFFSFFSPFFRPFSALFSVLCPFSHPRGQQPEKYVPFREKYDFFAKNKNFNGIFTTFYKTITTSPSPGRGKSCVQSATGRDKRKFKKSHRRRRRKCAKKHPFRTEREREKENGAVILPGGTESDRMKFNGGTAKENALAIGGHGILPHKFCRANSAAADGIETARGASGRQDHPSNGWLAQAL